MPRFSGDGQAIERMGPEDDVVPTAHELDVDAQFADDAGRGVRRAGSHAAEGVQCRRVFVRGQERGHGADAGGNLRHGQS